MVGRWILVIALAMGVFQASAQQSKPCLTDELQVHLKKAYPQGVPGRAPAADAKTDYEFSYVIPVVFHVMHDYGSERSVTVAQMLSQLEVLNEDYNKLGSGANSHPDGGNAKVTFCLATVDPDGNPHPGYEYVEYPPAVNIDPYTEDTIMKRINQWDPTRYLNVWTVRRIANGSIRGYAYFPDEVAGTIWDGLVLDHRYMGKSEGTAISMGRTATHEVGHYLGLYHPWGLTELGCFTEDDECDDTPKVMDSYFATAPFCNAPLACDELTPRQVENYMDYSADGCMNMFSNCQVDRMRYNIARYRATLVGIENLANTGCKPAADSLDVVGEYYLYPNPAHDFLMALPVNTDTNAFVSYRIFDTQGRKVLEKRIEANPIAPVAIDLTGISMGLYILRIENGSKTYKTKFIIDR